MRYVNDRARRQTKVGIFATAIIIRRRERENGRYFSVLLSLIHFTPTTPHQDKYESKFFVFSVSIKILPQRTGLSQTNCDIFVAIHES